MITYRDLVQRLARRSPSAWSVVERIQDHAIADELRPLHRRDHRTLLTLIVHQDVPRGRGTARLDIDSHDGSADDLIDRAIALALAAVGPAWSSAPPAAPAKVNLVDDDLLKRELDAIAASTLARLRRPPGLAITATAHALREKVTVVASSGFRTSWLATSLRADATLSTSTASPSPSSPPTTQSYGTTAPASRTTSAAASATAARTTDHSLTISLQARRTEDFRLDEAVAAAAADLLRLADAGPPTPGPCALWLGPEALLHDDTSRNPYGVWAIFAHHADSAVERLGLTRYRWRSEIAPNASHIPEPLSILSNGALDFAILSSPVSDDAAAIRRFPLIERGIAVGLGLSPREAALRRTDPNGGVRNLVVSPGTWPQALPSTIRTIEVRRLHALSIDLTAGDASFDIALGFEHRPGRAAPTPFTGGTIHLDLVTALSRARRSSQLLRRGAYHGPASLLIDDADLIA
jgi:hypothetical protein